MPTLIPTNSNKNGLKQLFKLYASFILEETCFVLTCFGSKNEQIPGRDLVLAGIDQTLGASGTWTGSEKGRLLAVAAWLLVNSIRTAARFWSGQMVVKGAWFYLRKVAEAKDFPILFAIFLFFQRFHHFPDFFQFFFGIFLFAKISLSFLSGLFRISPEEAVYIFLLLFQTLGVKHMAKSSLSLDFFASPLCFSFQKAANFKERIQFAMLQLQNLGNVWRRNAFKTVMAGFEMVTSEGGSSSTALNLWVFHDV